MINYMLINFWNHNTPKGEAIKKAIEALKEMSLNETYRLEIADNETMRKI